jgi:hypothetical protein
VTHVRLVPVVAALSFLWLLAACPPAAAQEKRPETTMKLGKVPDVRLNPRLAVGEEQAKWIKRLIAELADLDGASVGVSATLSGHDFAPVPGQSQVGVLMLTDHRLKPSPVFRELVSLGPDALPFLLDALDDKTPTKIVIKHEFGIGGMWYGGELYLSPVNPAEAKVYEAREAVRRPQEIDIKPQTSHTVTVGDVCFVAIGQIVGRPYEAVRYQPTACIVINSPTQDARLCADVRAIWASKDPTRKLFDSFLADYATEGRNEGDELEIGWERASMLQCNAALRLLYYFPTESAGFIAERLDKLDVAETADVEEGIRQYHANRVRTERFIQAVSWSKQPAVRATVTRLFKRAGDEHSLLAALSGIDDPELIHERLESLLDKIPADAPYYEGRDLLAALAARTPDTAKPVFQRFLRGASPQRCMTVCLALSEATVPWDADVLGPLLDDERETDWTYSADPKKNQPRLLRVCDAAARTLAGNHPEFKFTLAGEHADLDKQIAVIRDQIGRKKN